MPGVPVPPGAETRMTAVQLVQVARALLVPYLEQFKRPEAPVGLRLRAPQQRQTLALPRDVQRVSV